MKKFIAAGAAATMLAFSGTAAYAAYEPTTETDVKPQTDGKVEDGKKEKIRVKPRVQGDDAQCTGAIFLIYKDGKEVLREREKPTEETVVFNAIVPGGTTKIVVIYQRGPKDPCDKSKAVIVVE